MIFYPKESRSIHYSSRFSILIIVPYARCFAYVIDFSVKQYLPNLQLEIALILVDAFLIVVTSSLQ